MAAPPVGVIDPMVHQLLLWLIATLVTVCLALLGVVWRRLERRIDELVDRAEAIDKCVDRRFDVSDLRLSAGQERLARVEEGQHNITGWLGRIDVRLEQIRTRHEA